MDVLHRCFASGRSLIWSTKGTLFCLIHVWAGLTPLHMDWFLETFSCDNYWMMKKASFRFWSKCENCFLTFSPTREVCSLTLSVLHTCRWTSAVLFPVLCWSEPSRVKENNTKCIIGWLRKLWVLKACAFGRTVIALRGVTVLHHELTSMLMLVWGFCCLGISVAPCFPVHRGKSQYLVLLFFCTSYRTALLILIRTLLSDPAFSIPITFTTLAAFLH